MVNGNSRDERLKEAIREARKEQIKQAFKSGARKVAKVSVRVAKATGRGLEKGAVKGLDVASKVGSRISKQKLLKKPKFKIKKLSAIKVLQSLTTSPLTQLDQERELQIRLARRLSNQVPIPQDNRSLFFREEFFNEKRNEINFLS